MKMNDKDPELVTILLGVYEASKVFVLAALVAVTRILWDGKEQSWLRIALECALCGFLAQGVHSLAEVAFSWDMPTAIAAAVGMVGPSYLRMKLRKAINKKLDNQ